MTRNTYTHLIPENSSPPGVKKMVVCDADGVKQGSIYIPVRMQYPTGTKLYSFLALADVHLTYDTANEDFQRALTFAENSDCLFTCIAGDLTSTGSDSEMETFKSVVDTYAKTKPVYAIGGNHESIWGNMTYDRTTPYTGKPLYYSFTQGNDVFIMLGHYGAYQGDGIGWLASEFITKEELQFLYEALEENRNKRCFVFNHVYPYEDGVGDAGRAYNGRYWLTTDNGIGQAFVSLLKHYKNTILFHGHSHLRFDLQEIDEKANYSSVVGYRSVHIPSLSVPRDIIDGTTDYVYAESEGYVVDVFENCIVLRGRDFIDNDNDGNWLPIATYKIDTTLQTIEAGTFTDDTGTIVT